MKQILPKIFKVICITVVLSFFQQLNAQGIGPGGVSSGLSMWLKADAGFSENSSTDVEWQDQSTNNFILNSNLVSGSDGISAPNFNSNSINYNAGITFDGVDTGMSTAINTVNFNFSNWTVFSVQAIKNNTISNCIWHYNNDGKNDLALFIDPNPSGFNFAVNNVSDGIITSPTIDDGKPYLVVHTSNNSATSTFVNSDLVNTGSVTVPLPGNGAFMVGLDADGSEANDGDNHLDGDIGEIIIYNYNLSNVERQKVNTYLALKYGISLDQTTATNYVSSNGTTIWNATTNVSYNTDIFGIGEDTNSGLDQKVSRSVNNVNSPILATTQHFTEANSDALRSTSLGDGNFIMMGHNNGSLAFESSYNGGSNNLLSRVWKVDETGTVGNVYFAIPKAYYNFPSSVIPVVVMSDDTTFSNTDTVVNLIDDGSFYWAEINPSDGQYLSIAFTEPSFTVSKSALTIDENGDTDTFTVVLDVQPRSNVVIEVASDDTDEAMVDTATLTFTTSNWNQAQTVTVTGVNDAVKTEDSATITVSVKDADSDDVFDVLENQTVIITLTNDDASFSLPSISNELISENTAYQSITPSLSGDAPIGNVVYTLSGDDATKFTVNSETGVVNMVARDFENPEDNDADNKYNVTLIATDTKGNSSNTSWFVAIIDDDGIEVLTQIGLEADSPDTVNSVVTVEQLNTIKNLTGVIEANETAYQDYIDANPESFSSPALLSEVQSMVNNVNATLGVTKNQTESFVIYPNPVSSILNLEFNNTDVGLVAIEVYNTVGQKVMTKTQDKGQSIDINVTSLKSGVYFIKVSTNKTEFTKRIVKE